MSQTSATDTRTDRLATIVTNVFAPAHLVIGLLLLVGAASHPSPAQGLAWGALAALVVGVLPYAWVLRAVRTGRFVSRHVPDRAQRMVPLAVAAGAAIIGLAVVAVVAVLGAPPQLVALIVAMVAGLAVTAAITHYWKISLHTAVAAGTAAILTIVYGPALLTTGALVAVIGWSRIQQRAHTPQQVLAGGLLGAAIAAALLAVLALIAFDDQPDDAERADSLQRARRVATELGLPDPAGGLPRAAALIAEGAGTDDPDALVKRVLELVEEPEPEGGDPQDGVDDDN